jgi:hypothetical protein
MPGCLGITVSAEVELRDVMGLADVATTAIALTVLAVEPMSSGRLFALVSAEIDIEGVVVIVHGIQAMLDPSGTRIELPKYRDHAGTL